MRCYHRRTSQRLVEKVKLAKREVIKETIMADISEDINVTSVEEREAHLISELRESKRKEEKYRHEVEVLENKLANITHIQSETEKATGELYQVNEKVRDQRQLMAELEEQIKEKEDYLNKLDEEVEVTQGRSAASEERRGSVDDDEISSDGRSRNTGRDSDINENDSDGRSRNTGRDSNINESLLRVLESLVASQRKERENFSRVSEKEDRLPPFNGALPRFSANQDPENFVNVEVFIQMLEYAMPSGQWSDRQRVLGAMQALGGEVLNQVRCLPEVERNTWTRFKGVLREKFAVSDQTLAFLKSKFKPKRKSGEDVLSFVFRVRGGLMNFDPKGVWTGEKKVSELIDILENEAPPEVCPLLYILPDSSNTSLRKLADGWNRISRRKNANEKIHPFVERDAGAIHRSARGWEPRMGRGGGYATPHGSGPFKERGRGRPLEGAARGRGIENSRCFNCGGGDHWARKCPRPLKCYRCQGYGHRAEDCRGNRGGNYSAKNESAWGGVGGGWKRGRSARVAPAQQVYAENPTPPGSPSRRNPAPSRERRE